MAQIGRSATDATLFKLAKEMRQPRFRIRVEVNTEAPYINYRYEIRTKGILVYAGDTQNVDEIGKLVTMYIKDELKRKIEIR